MVSSAKYSENALDLIRLVAALQVAFLHTVEILQLSIADTWQFSLIHYFPGVPIFFFVSGYLISRSYERSPSIVGYASNRFLRIFPGLWVCIVFNLLLIATTGYFVINEVPITEIFVLAAAKSTILQFYNPDFMREFGDGVLNGSLWTITVELQFYFIVPLLYKVLLDKFKKKNLLILILIVLFVMANRLLYYFEPAYSDTVLWKLCRVSFAPWFYMFLIGVLVQRNFELFYFWIEKIPLQIYLLVFCGAVYFIYDLSWVIGNDINPLFFLIVAVLVFKLSYSPAVKNAAKFLRGNDLSYGIYIFHMPILNQFIYLNYEKGVLELIMLFSVYLLMALLSWLIIEKPALKLKRFSLKS